MACNALMRTLKAAFLIVLMAVVLACNNGPRNIYQGYIEGDYLYLSSSVGGTVANVPVAKGTRVEAGAVLFELDPEPERAAYQEALSQFEAAQALYEDKTKGQRSSELAAIEASIRQADAALAFSKKEYERLKELFEKAIIAQDKLDSSKSAYDRDRAAVAELRARLKTAGLGARYDQIAAAGKDVERARAALDKAEWALNQKRGFAPASGLVVDVLYSKGEFVPSGYPMVVFLPPEKVRARFFVPEPKLAAIKTGQKIYVTLDGRVTPSEGVITYISPEAEYTPPFIYSKDNREKLVFMVEASFAPEVARGLNPGQPVEVRLSP
jgi:HlyD family secretion protein